MTGQWLCNWVVSTNANDWSAAMQLGGQVRCNFEGQKLTHGGLRIGDKYTIRSDKAARRLELIAVPTSFVGSTFTVSKRERNGIVHPLLQLRSDEIRQVFEDDEKVRIAIRNGRIVITALQLQTKIRERLKRLKEKLARGEKLAVTSLFHGGGVLDRAIHSGLLRAGVGSFVQVGVELEAEYLNASLRNNPDLWQADSIAICSDIRYVSLEGNIPQSDILTGGVPCVGASKAGRAKNDLEFAEEHDSAGTLFFDYLAWVKATNPAIVVLENVPEYQSTASMAVIRSVLISLGYVLKEKVLDGSDFGALEKRKRMVMIAYTPGLGDLFSFENLKPHKVREASINEILESVPLDSPRWKPYTYLSEKAVKDKATGKNFALQRLTGNEGGCGTIGRHYFKGRSTEPFLIHPENPDLFRLFTRLEHGRVKTIPAVVTEGVSETAAHEIMGQSVVYEQFDSIGEEIGLSLFRTNIELPVSRDSLSLDVKSLIAGPDFTQNLNPASLMLPSVVAVGSTQQMLL
ncbi:DNA cytosine methyltransferase (plasmid) [Pseudomonas frederiksbergensis]|uniref:DNA cytosine methyltransferase n=1 Tax=Pseudomonas frederiksbergensis TaxID=104087 RepID=A0A1J0ETT6_9PSED|nr:DNA cytosine methyltransferase [Pseudomonas frederiksbergensis]APC19406.1 DNA cytosine methyltransferase [Pseudomonas frederiksbergensis]